MFLYVILFTLKLWIELCELISRNPTKIFSLNVDAIIRQGIQRFVSYVLLSLKFVENLMKKLIYHLKYCKSGNMLKIVRPICFFIVFVFL